MFLATQYVNVCLCIPMNMEEHWTLKWLRKKVKRK